MAGINYGRVLLGGLVAGIVINFGEFILNIPILGANWEAVREARNLTDFPEPSMVWYVVLSLVLGIAIVWLYAAIRPRFGPGIRTAVCAGLVVWFICWFWCMIFFYLQGFTTGRIYFISLVWGLVEVPLAAVAGAWLYKEGQSGTE